MNASEKWTEILIKIPVMFSETAESIMHMASPYGIYVEDYSSLEEEAMEIAHIDLISEELLSKDRENAVIHIYVSEYDNPQETLAFIEERLKSEKIPFERQTGESDMNEWLTGWKKYFKPLKIGDKLVIRPSWESLENDEGRVVLSIDPGIAFGTGSHESTRMCLEFSEKYIKEGNKVLDIGCGSGILSICALLFGAEEAIGIDIDPLAVKSAEENAKLNSFEGRFTSVCGDLTEKVSGKFDVIYANIVADVIIKLSENVDNFMHKNSFLIISGIIDTRYEEVKEILLEKFRLLEEKFQKGWVSAVLMLK